MKRRIVISSVIAFFLGLVCFKAIDSYKAITFDPKFSLGELIESVTELLVAFIVASFLEKQGQEERGEKELLLRHMDLILRDVDELEKFREGGILLALNASLKRVSMSCKSMKGILVELKCPKEVSDIMQFEPIIRKIRQLATDTPIRELEEHAHSPVCSSVVRDGIISLAAEKTASLDMNIQHLKTSIIKAQIKINRM